MTDWTTPQAPASITHQGGASGARAGFAPRLGASLVDGIIVAVVTQGLAALIGNTAVTIVLYLLGAVYYVVLEGGPSGQTLGKKAAGIRVTGLADGAPIGYGRAAIRYLGRIVSSIPVFLGYFWMLWDGEKQTWHDKFARCVVVPAPPS
jgi:uncharacterized RDD family membrane protein YckC